jgi:eukaryotic-like serine/threonine-protein kinase
MLFKTRVWSAGKLLLLVGALLATYALFAAGAMRIALRAREVVVPDLRGRTIAEATAALADGGIRLRVEDPRRIDPRVPAGAILAQEPGPGTPVRPQRSIKVWISAGARASTVPALEGQGVRSAEMRLKQDGLDITALAEIRSADYVPEAVVAQDPAPQSAATGVALLVNRGQAGATYVMPDLIGVNGDRAADLLRARGFRVAVVGQQPYPGVPAGVVIRQAPQGGFQIAPGEAISLEVSR